MIERLRELDDDTVIADGPKFDLPKDLEVALKIVETLRRRADMRFPGQEGPCYRFTFDDDDRPYDDESAGLIASVFEECRLTRYDVTPFSCELRFGPYMADLYALGFEGLNGPVGSCL